MYELFSVTLYKQRFYRIKKGAVVAGTAAKNKLNSTVKSIV